jgi:hypothetical protein
VSRPTTAWRRATQARCDRCSRLLVFLEGPICDPCLDADEQRYPRSLCYKNFESAEHEEERFRSPCEEVDAYDRVRRDARTSLSVDLRTGEVFVFPRRQPITVSEKRRA